MNLPLMNAFLAQQPAPEGNGALVQFLTLGLLAAGMWFLLIAPQRKKQKQHQKMLETLKSGDHILTAGGMHGVITNVKDDRFVIRIAENTKIEIAKGFIQSKIEDATPAAS